VSRAVAIGSEVRLAGYALAGAEVIDADDAEAVRQAIEQLADDVALVILAEDPGPAGRAALKRRRGAVWCLLPS
jgi:vacuolar-type H+-ATPase subunit F/Vma7